MAFYTSYPKIDVTICKFAVDHSVDKLFMPRSTVTHCNFCLQKKYLTNKIMFFYYSPGNQSQELTYFRPVKPNLVDLLSTTVC